MPFGHACLNARSASVPTSQRVQKDSAIAFATFCKGGPTAHNKLWHMQLHSCYCTTASKDYTTASSDKTLDERC